MNALNPLCSFVLVASAVCVSPASAQWRSEEAHGLHEPPLGSDTQVAAGARAEVATDEVAADAEAADFGSVDDAAADEDVNAPLFRGEVLAGTTLPLDLSIGARLVVADYVFAETTVGRSAYGGIAGAVALSLGGEEVATLLEPAFTGAWIVRFGLGVRPFGQDGPELSAGYARMTSAATWAAADLSLPSSAGDLSADIALHLFYVELGWSIDVYGPLFVRPAVGWSQVFDARLELSSSATLSSQAAAALVSAETSAESIIEQYGRTPTLSLSVGARF